MSNIRKLKPKYDVTLADKVEQLRTLDRELKRVERAYTDLKTNIIEEMGENNRVVDHLGHEIATYTTQVRNGFDSKAFGKEHPDMVKKYTKQTEYKTFRLK